MKTIAPPPIRWRSAAPAMQAKPAITVGPTTPPPPTKFGSSLSGQAKSAGSATRRDIRASTPRFNSTPCRSITVRDVAQRAGAESAPTANVPPPVMPSAARGRDITSLVQRNAQTTLRRWQPPVLQRALASSSTISPAHLRAKFSAEDIEQASGTIKILMVGYNKAHDAPSWEAPHLARMQAILDKIAVLTLEARGLRVYSSVSVQQAPVAVGALFAHDERGPYYVFPTSHGSPPASVDAFVANGKYCFAILASKPNEVRVCPAGVEGIGHSSLTRNGPVLYAGTVTFDQGRLISWNNDTGHYRTEVGNAAQAGIVPVDTLQHALLPLSKFVAFTVV